jgi:hypothetical protein
MEQLSPARITELIAAEAELKRQRENKSAKAREWYANHKEELKQRYEANKERRAAYYETNKERILQQQRARYYQRKAIVILAPPINNVAN